MWGRRNAKLNHLKLIPINRTIHSLLFNINKWNLKVIISGWLFFVFQFYIRLPNYGFGETLQIYKFIFWAKKVKYESFLVRKFWSAWYKVCHDQPDSPSWYTGSWPYIAPPRVEPHSLPASFVIDPLILPREKYPYNTIKVWRCTPTKARKVRSANNCTYRLNRSLP